MMRSQTYTTTGIYSEILVGSNGCDSISIIDLVVLPSNDPDCIASSTDEFDLEISISPNPFRDFLNLHCSCDQELEVSIYNLNGQKLTSEIVRFQNNRMQIGTSQLSPGVYMISGIDRLGNQYFTEKLVKVQ